MVLAPLAATTLGSPRLAAPERLPQFGPANSCRYGGAPWGTPRQASESRVRSEQEARATLDKTWSEILPADGRNCSLLVSTGGPPTCVELLSCIEMARDARAYRQRRAKSAAEPPPVVAAPRTPPRSKAPHLERSVGTRQREAAS